MSLTAIGSIAGVVAIASQQSALTVTLAAVGVGVGAEVGWLVHLKIERGSSRWWLVLAVGLSTLLISTPEAVQTVVIGTVSGFLVVCGVVMSRRYVLPARRGSQLQGDE